MAWIVKPSATAVTEKRDQPYLTDELKEYLERVYLPRYEVKRGALLPTLHAVQEKVGYLPLQALEEIAEFLELAPSEVIDTASFYEEFYLEPKGDYVIGVCRSIACEVCGYQEVIDAVKNRLGIEPGETTPDGKFTLIEMECLGSCGTAPVALVNEDLQEDLSPSGLLALIDTLPDIEHKDNPTGDNINSTDSHDEIAVSKVGNPVAGEEE